MELKYSAKRIDPKKVVEKAQSAVIIVIVDDDARKTTETSKEQAHAWMVIVAVIVWRCKGPNIWDG